MRSGKQGLALFLAVGLILAETPALSPVFAAKESMPGEVLFSFVEALPRAQAIRQGRLKETEGAWSEDRFMFEALPGQSDIFVTDSTVVSGQRRQAIWFQPLGNSESSLVYSDVPPGRKLAVFFALPDAFSQQKKVVPIEFEVWIGKKKLYVTRVSGKGWREQVIDLSLPRLLGRQFRVTFRIRASSNEPTAFVFHGRIE